MLSYLAKAALDVNQRWLSLFGFKRHEVLGKTPAEISVWRNMEVRSALHEALRRGEVVEEKEVILRTRCGEELICLLSAQMIDFIGERSILSSFVDITELKRAEQSLREADRRKDGFLAALSHELRNPLAPLTNSLYVLDRVSPVSEEGRRAKAVIGRQIAHLSNLVNDLLDFTRITQGKVRLAKERLDLNRLVLRAVEDNRSLFDDGDVELRCDGLPGLFITADPTRITQVLGNLLQNCAKFTPRGGRAVVSLSVQGSVAQIEVADDGVGMSEDTLLHLFQPFAQAEQSLDRNTGGLGLGLALVKGLVELHEGEVWATSPGIDCGSLITIHLPLDAPQGRVEGRKRILIIEDNRDAAETLRLALSLSDHEVEVAFDGSNGLRIARRFHPDVVLCDIGLPGMDGFEVARAFRSDEALSASLLVALSGYAQPSDIERGRDAGFDLHFAKPLQVEKIEELLSDL